MESRRKAGNGRGEEGEEEAYCACPKGTERAPAELQGAPLRELLRCIGMGIGWDGRERFDCGGWGGACNGVCGRGALVAGECETSLRRFSRAMLSMMVCCSAMSASLPSKFMSSLRSRSASTRRWNSARAWARMSAMLSSYSRWIAARSSGVVAAASAASFSAFTSSTRKRLNSASTSSLSASTHGSGPGRGTGTGCGKV